MGAINRAAQRDVAPSVPSKYRVSFRAEAAGDGVYPLRERTEHTARFAQFLEGRHGEVEARDSKPGR
jgi:hypothetical protein